MSGQPIIPYDPLLESQTLDERLATLEILTGKLTKLALQESRPIDHVVTFSGVHPYIVNYKDRKHIFVLSPTSITVTGDQGITLILAASEWVNLGFTQGMRLFATGQTSGVPLFVRCTDEVIP